MRALQTILALTLLPLVLSDSLTSAGTCVNLLDYLKTNGLKRVGPYGFSPFSPILSRGGPVLLSNIQAAAAPSGAAPEPRPPEAGVDFSETNVQVEGVDEPDIVKTDGKRVFALRGINFFVVDVTDSGASGNKTGQLRLPTTGSEMLFEGGTVLVISRTFSGLEERPLSASPTNTGTFLTRPFPSSPVTVIYQIDVSGPAPLLDATLRMEGSYISSREVDGIARIVLKFDASQKLQFVYPGSGIPLPRPTLTEGAVAALEPSQVNSQENAKRVNQDVIRKSTLSNWLPRYTLETDCTIKQCLKKKSGFITRCSNVFLPSGNFTGFGLLTVVSLPLRGTIQPRNSVSIVSDSGDVYSTATSLYVATTEYRYDFPTNSIFLGAFFKTSIHKFNLQKTGATYAGSGTVSGSVLNQFSMHEFKGFFYVATTEGAAWWSLRDTSKSKITAFKLIERKLIKVGEVGNLGIGERIFAVRYIDTTAYVVTFRQIDPLYIIDLSQPTRLRVTGELKIPGFSSYLHPVGDGRLLGVGREATPEGRTTGAKVTLFDVSDETNPTELAVWTLEGSFTNAQFDHRAFLFWTPESIAVLPVTVSSVNTKERFSGSIVLEVSNTSIKERGRITHQFCCGLLSPPSIERNFVLGRTHLWSLSRELLQVNGIRDLMFESSVELAST